MHIEVQERYVEPARAAALREESLCVHRRSKQANPNLALFIHGLGGSRYGKDSTWGHFPRLLFERFPAVDIGLYQYRSGLGRIKFWRSLNLESEAQILADLIRDAGYESAVMIAHSMGGLLVKAAIRDLINRPDRAALASIGGVFLLATPQVGSFRVPRLLARLNPDMRALAAHSKLVQDITKTFNNRVVFEALTLPPDKFLIPTWGVVAGADFWVDELSAAFDIPDGRLKRVNETHGGLVKPADDSSPAFDWVVARIKTILEEANGQRTDQLAPSLGPVGLAQEVDHSIFPRLTEIPQSQLLRLDAQLAEVAAAVRRGLQAGAGGEQISKRLVVFRVLGEGSIGRVWLGYDLIREQPVAVKLLHAGLANDDSARGLFVAGGQTIIGIQDGTPSRVVQVLDGPKSNESGTFYVMELFGSRNLEEWIGLQQSSAEVEPGPGRHGGPVDPGLIQKVITSVGEALRLLHRHDLVHCDVMPRNILVTESCEVKLADFDLLRRKGEVAGSGARFHTLPYAAPEQLDGGSQLEPTVDIYSLGLIVVYLLFGGPLPVAQCTHRLPAFIEDLACPRATKAVLLRATAFAPTERYKNVRDFLSSFGADAFRPGGRSASTEVRRSFR